jgi:Na+-driven multidrug efflux pump
MRRTKAEYRKSQSRKWKLVLLVVVLATVGTFVPPMLSAWLFKSATPLIIISGTEYVSVLTLVVSAYFGANVIQKHVEGKANASIHLETNLDVDGDV